MAIDPKKRQKQLAKKAARRKTVRAEAKTAHAGGGAGYAKQVAFAANLPIHECLAPESLFEIGMGNVIVSRGLPNGEIAVSVFLVDAYCLGIKDAFFAQLSRSEYHRVVLRFGRPEKLVNVDPPYARKLVEGAEAYAKDIGFAPHPDYSLARNIFGDIDASACPTDFTFGKDGMPFFIAGPDDTPANRKKIMDKLLRRFGPEGFHFIIEEELED